MGTESGGADAAGGAAWAAAPQEAQKRAFSLIRLPQLMQNIVYAPFIWQCPPIAVNGFAHILSRNRVTLAARSDFPVIGVSLGRIVPVFILQMDCLPGYADATDFQGINDGRNLGAGLI